MVTLDEVIKGMTELILSGKTADVKSTVRDALHYLKVLQKMQKTQPLEKSEWDELYNQPLTWQELKTMEGKPVWVVEGQYPHSWCIVREVQKYMDGTEEIVLDGLNCKIGIGRKEEYGTGWQAYRKERK